MKKRDYYEILGLEKGADESDLKKAYRQLALKFHPDRNPGDASAEEKFKEASEAYEVLSTPEKRQMYDRFGHAGLSGAGHHGFHDVNDIFSSFGSIFDEFFGFSGGGGRRSGRAGRDMRYDLTISLKDALQGANQNIEFQRPCTCESCAGTGARSPSDKKTCDTCGGIGQVRRSQGFFSVQTACPTCRGEGSVIVHPCASCKGKGQTLQSKSLAVKIPAGVDSGMQLRLSGEGEPGAGGGQPGDLYVVIEVEESENWYREESNLVLKHPISMTQAALGCKLEIETPLGSEAIEVKAGTQYGHRIVVPSKGFPSLRGRGKGDLIVELLVFIPKKLQKEQRELLEKLAESMDESHHTGSSGGFFQRLFQQD